MTEEERNRAFRKAIEDACAQYGFQIGAQIQSRTLGPVVQCEPIIVFTLLDDWQPPSMLTADSKNGKNEQEK